MQARFEDERAAGQANDPVQGRAATDAQRVRGTGHSLEGQRWRMADTLRYDVFLSHRSKDKAIVRPPAERLRTDGLRVRFDEWEIKPGDSIPAKIEKGLERSRALVL